MRYIILFALLTTSVTCQFHLSSVGQQQTHARLVHFTQPEQHSTHFVSNRIDQPQPNRPVTVLRLLNRPAPIVQQPTRQISIQPSLSIAQRPLVATIQQPSVTIIRQPQTVTRPQLSVAPAPQPPTSAFHQPQVAPVQQQFARLVQRPQFAVPQQQRQPAIFQQQTARIIQQPTTTVVQRPPQSVVVQRPVTVVQQQQPVRQQVILTAQQPVPSPATFGNLMTVQQQPIQVQQQPIQVQQQPIQVQQQPVQAQSGLYYVQAPPAVSAQETAAAKAAAAHQRRLHFQALAEVLREDEQEAV